MRPDPAPTPAAKTPRVRRAFALLAVLLAVLLAALALVAVAGIAWLGSRSALDYAVAELQRRAGGGLVVEGASGSLTSSFSARRITYDTPDFNFVAEDVAITWSPAALWSRRVAIDGLGAKRVTITIAATSAVTGLPASLALPLTVDVAHAGIARLEIRDGATTRAFEGIAFAYAGGPDGHALSDIALAADVGRIAGSLAIAATAPFGTRGTFTAAGAGPLEHVTATVTVGGSLAALDVKAALDVGGATADATATIAPLTAAPVRAATLDARRIDLAAVDPAWPHTAIEAKLDATADRDGRLAGRFTATNALPGAISSQRLPIVALAGRFAVATDAVELADLAADFGAAGRASGRGRVAFGPAPASDWRLDVRDVDLQRLHAPLAATKFSGTLRAFVTGREQRYEADFSERNLALAFAATVVGDAVDVQRFRARAGGGELTGTASYRGTGTQPFAVTATALHFDPSRFGDFPSASLDGHVTASGTLAPTWSADVALVLAPTARIAGAPVGGSLRATLAAQSVRDASVDLKLATATLQARGSFGHIGDRLDFAIDAPQLADVAPLAGARAPARLAGRLVATGHVDGTFADPGFGVEARGASLQIGAIALGSLDLRASLAAGGNAELRERPLSIAATAARLTTTAGAYATATARIDGTLAHHTATLTLVGEGVDADARLDGGVTGDGTARTWAGTLAALQNRGGWATSLAAPARVELAAGRARIDDARLAIADGTMQIATLAWDAGRVTTRGVFAGVPLAALARLAGSTLPLRSTLILGGDWNVAAAPRLNGAVAVHRERGDLFAGAGGDADTGQVAFGLTAADVAATFADDALDLRLALDATRLGTVRATLAFGRDPAAPPGRIAAAAPLTASLHAEIASLAPLQPLVGTGAFVDGRVTLDVAATGTRERALLTGAVAGTGLRLDAPQYGLHWKDGRINARVADDAVTLDEFSFAGGDGRFTASGTLPTVRAGISDGVRALEAGTRIAWRANRFRATNRPDLQLVVSGRGTLGIANKRLTLGGALTVDVGRYEFVDSRGTTLSADVVVKGRPRAVEPARFGNVPLAVDLDLDLGNALTVQGKGLDTGLAGHVRVTATPGGALTGKGTIRAVNGSYYAFGQRLTIDRGRLLFDGPLDNPALDIVALRKNLAVEAGVEVTGSVNLPVVRLVSVPPVSDGEKLSWLVLGQGLDRTSGTDAAALQAAAATLFGDGQAPIGTTIARSIGVDDITVRSAGTTATGSTTGGVGSQVVAVGKRLSDKLYLVYEQGLTVANNALKLDYALTHNVTLRAEAGIVSGFGIYYQRSFD
ncbi:MAG: translocation/assembly module TamB domain-containing protein [Betaproteobacteria bacterium]